MRYVLLKDVKPGMVLAQEVLDPSGRTLAEENSKITQYAIEKLIKIVPYVGTNTDSKSRLVVYITKGGKNFAGKSFH